MGEGVDKGVMGLGEGWSICRVGVGVGVSISLIKMPIEVVFAKTPHFSFPA